MADEPGTPAAEPPETPPGATSPPVAPPDPPGDPNAAPDPLEPRDGDPEPVAHLRREAAGYRTRLRDTEAQRDQLQARVDELERGQVEALAANAGMATPADLWLLVRDLDELRRDGQLDHAAVDERVKAILADRPSWRKPAIDYGGGSRIGNGLGRRDLGLYDLLQQSKLEKRR